jgi:YHS domain-containing protein
MPSIRTLVLAAASLASLSLAGTLYAQGEKVKCPVSGAEVTVTDKTKSVAVNGNKLSFCCDKCPKAFADNPEKFVKDAGKCPVNKAGAAKISRESRVVLNNDLHYFCCANCPKAFAGDPSKFVKEVKDPVTGKTFAVKADSPKTVVHGQIYLFASGDNKAAFEKDRDKYVIAYK